jgi:hypothetical protein
MKYAPVLLFVYNRPWHTSETLKYLGKNEEAKDTDLIVYSDGPKDYQVRPKVNEVRSLLRQVSGFKSVTVIERETNFGLSKSIIAGVTEVIEKFRIAIILEDDIVVSESFLGYMNKALNRYADNPAIASIHGWSFPISGNLPDTFFLKGADCWGWGTWQRAWNFFEPDGVKLLTELHRRGLTAEFDMDGGYPYTQMLRDQIAGKNNSWAIRWHASAYLMNMVTLHPGKSMVRNIGLDGSGAHSQYEKALETQLSQLADPAFPRDIEADVRMRNKIIKYLKMNSPHVGSWTRLRNFTSRIVNRFRRQRNEKSSKTDFHKG